MGLEIANNIDELNPLWPLGSDPVAEADNHLRLIKTVLQTDFRTIYKYVRIKSFLIGAVVDSTQALFNESDGDYYYWTGVYPSGGYIVPPASTPETAGGVGEGKWINVGDASYKYELNSDTGYQEVGDNIVARLSTLKAKFGVAAWAQAANYKIFHIDVDDTKSDPYVVPSNQTIILDAAVTHTAASKCFDFQGASGWRLTGNGSLLGGTTRPLTQVSAHIGLNIIDCFRYKIDGDITVKYFGGVGFYGDGTSEISGDVSFSTVVGLRCEENHVNYQLMNGFQQEYVTFVGCWGVRATLSNGILETGNIYWIGGGLSHGYTDGLRLQHPAGGGNPHHGMFVGTEFNHNADHNLLAVGVAFGMNFANCAWFNGGSSTAGDIYINSSRGIQIDGGILGCDVRVVEDTGQPHTGWNAIKNMHCFPVGWSSLGPRLITGGSFSRNRLMVRGNFTNDGPWIDNDVGSAGVYANYRAVSNIQMTSGAQTIKMTGKMRDDRNSYDINTGFFTAPMAGILRIRADLHLLTNSQVQTANHQLLMFRDDSGSGSSFVQLGRQKVVAGSGNTTASVNAVFEIPVSKGAKVLLQYAAPDFATQICNIDSNYSSISFEML